MAFGQTPNFIQNEQPSQDPGFGSPVFAPDIRKKQQELRRAEAFAQMLAQQGQQPNDGRMVSGHWVPPSLGVGLGNALNAYAQMKTGEDIMQKQQELQEASQAQLAQGFGMGGGGAASAPQLPLLPGRTAQESYQVAQGVGLPAYLKMFGEQSNQKPIAVAPGGTLVDPRTNQPMFTAAQGGIQMQYGPSGPTAQMVPGYAQAAAQTAGAETLANEQARSMMDLVQVPDGRGGMITMPRSEAIQMTQQQGNQGQQAGAQPSPQGGGIGYTESPESIKAREELSSVEASTAPMIETIDKLLAHPGKENSFGIRGAFPTIPGSASADFQAMKDQIQGQAFLQGFQQLKGGGAITEVEGKKAEQSIARLQGAQSVESFNAAMQDLKETLNRGLERARSKAESFQKPSGQQSQPTGGGFSNLWGG